MHVLLGRNDHTATVFRAGERELTVTVDVVDGAFVVWLETVGDELDPWEPTPDLLRVNVNDGPIWNYPYTHTYANMPEDQR